MLLDLVGLLRILQIGVFLLKSFAVQVPENKGSVWIFWNFIYYHASTSSHSHSKFACSIMCIFFIFFNFIMLLYVVVELYVL